MLDGTYQTLTNLQYIDSLNFNIRQLMTALENGSSIPENSVNFSINNERIVQPQMINYLIGWDSFIQSSFNKSLVI